MFQAAMIKGFEVRFHWQKPVRTPRFLTASAPSAVCPATLSSGPRAARDRGPLFSCVCHACERGEVGWGGGGGGTRCYTHR